MQRAGSLWEEFYKLCIWQVFIEIIKKASQEACTHASREMTAKTQHTFSGLRRLKIGSEHGSTPDPRGYVRMLSPHNLKPWGFCFLKQSLLISVCLQLAYIFDQMQNCTQHYLWGQQRLCISNRLPLRGQLVFRPYLG